MVSERVQEIHTYIHTSPRPCLRFMRFWLVLAPRRQREVGLSVFVLSWGYKIVRFYSSFFSLDFISSFAGMG